jgi:hypothetical protein
MSPAASGMIAKTFFLVKIIHRIGTRSLRGKKSLRENLAGYRVLFALRAARRAVLHNPQDLRFRSFSLGPINGCSTTPITPAEHLRFIAGKTLAIKVSVVLVAAPSTEITAAAEARCQARLGVVTFAVA